VTLVDLDGAAAVPAEATALLDQGALHLYGTGFHLDQGSHQALLVEAQGGGIVNEGFGRYFRHLQGAREDVGTARALSLRINSYVDKAEQLGEESAAGLKRLSTRLWDGTATTTAHSTAHAL
jgi:hypothetical protein